MLVRVSWEWVLDVPSEGDFEMHVKGVMTELESVPLADWPGSVAVLRVEPVEPWEDQRWWQ